MSALVNRETAVLLFDVDGVLIDPVAYKVGIQRVVEILCSEVGLSNPAVFLPDLSEIAFMESRGIHDVWDMTNIVCAIILKTIFQELCRRNALIGFKKNETAERLQELKSVSFEIERPDYTSFAEQIMEKCGVQHPPDLALSLILKGLSADSELIKSWKELFTSFLQGTRSVYESYGTRVFQNVILGTEEFEQTYGLKSEYSCSSLLLTEDRVLISEESVSLVKHLAEHEGARVAVYTARPSYPPPDAGKLTGYSPEAEIAVAAAGLKQFPMVGMGMMEWLASGHCERTENLTKPNTTHSFSALLAAIKQDNGSAILELAYELDKREVLAGASNDAGISKEHLRIFVFEDTSSGVKPMQALAEKLSSQGFSISVTGLGVAGDANKKEALESLSCLVFSDVNQALRHLRDILHAPS